MSSPDYWEFTISSPDYWEFTISGPDYHDHWEFTISRPEGRQPHALPLLLCFSSKLFTWIMWKTGHTLVFKGLL